MFQDSFSTDISSNLLDDESNYESDDGSTASLPIYDDYDESISDSEGVKPTSVADTTGFDTSNEIDTDEKTGNQGYLTAQCPKSSPSKRAKRDIPYLCLPRENPDGTETETETQGQSSETDQDPKPNTQNDQKPLPRATRNDFKCPYPFYGTANFVMCNAGSGRYHDIEMEQREYGMYYTLRNAIICKSFCHFILCLR